MVSSSNRTTAFGRYLIKLVESEGRTPSQSVTYSETNDPRRARRSESSGSSEKTWYNLTDARAEPEIRLSATAFAVLQLLDSTLYATQARKVGSGDSAHNFCYSLFSTLTELVRLSSPVEGKLALELHQSVYLLLSDWKTDDLLDIMHLMKLREAARTNYRTWLHWLEQKHPDDYRRLQQSSQVHTSLLDIPDYHGNHRDAWHRQPAGNMVGLIEGFKPIDIEDMRPLSTSSKTIDPELLDIVNRHIEEADRIFSMPKISPYLDDSDVQLNSLGLRVKKDPSTGKRKMMETYYGHSVSHIEQLKRRKTEPVPATKPAQQQPVQQFQQVPPPPPHSDSPSSFVPPPQAQRSFNNTPPFPPPPPFQAGQPPPPPPMSGAAIAPPLPFSFPPRPPNWQGPWPPPPPPPGGMGMQGSPPPPPPQYSQSPPNVSYGHRNGDDYSGDGYSGRGRGGWNGEGHGGRGRGGWNGDNHSSRGRGGWDSGRGRGHAQGRGRW